MLDMRLQCGGTVDANGPHSGRRYREVFVHVYPLPGNNSVSDRAKASLSVVPRGTMMKMSACLLSLVHLLGQVTMARSQSASYPQDPILSYRPPFIQSLPVQILVTAISLTLAAVLLLHLIFTAQYHWPLARTNYALQMTGVVTLLISISATIYVVFTATIRQSQHWPYMLNYLAVEMPAANYSTNSTDPTLIYQYLWSPKEKTTWVVMNATTSVIVQVRPLSVSPHAFSPPADYTHSLPYSTVSLQPRG